MGLIMRQIVIGTVTVFYRNKFYHNILISGKTKIENVCLSQSVQLLKNWRF